MKYLSILFIFVFSSVVFAQTPASSYKGTTIKEPRYINSEFNFSLTPPVGAVLNENYNRQSNSVVSYSCFPPVCQLSGVFSLSTIKQLNVPKADVIKTYQQEPVQEQVANVLTSSFPPENQVVILAKRYVEYDGRPAIILDYKFTDNKVTIIGTMTQMFVDEKKIMLGFNSIAEITQAEKWNKISETAIRSFSLSTDRLEARIPAIDGDQRILNFIAKSLARPEYPSAARAVRATGIVKVQVTVDQSGNVSSAKAISGHPLLQFASVEAARKAKFNPSDVTGGKLTGILIFNFEMPIFQPR